MVRCNVAQKIVDTFEATVAEMPPIVCMLSSFDSSHSRSSTRSKSNKDKVRWHLSQHNTAAFLFLPSESAHNNRTPNTMNTIHLIPFHLSDSLCAQDESLSSLLARPCRLFRRFLFLSSVCIVLARCSMVYSVHTLMPIVSSCLGCHFSLARHVQLLNLSIKPNEFALPCKVVRRQ